MVQPRNDLTVIRATACLLIVIYHMSRLNIPGIQALSRGGFIGNTIFFALSGYLLMLGSRDKSVNSAWIKKRLVRIYPSFWVSILIILLLSTSVGLNNTVKLADIFIYFTGLHYFGGVSSLGAHLWFISILIVCYLFFRPTRYLVVQASAALFSGLLALFLIIPALTFDGGGLS